MLLNPLAPLAFIKITSLKATTLFLLVLLIKSNLLRLKGGLIGGLFALILISGFLASFAIGGFNPWAAGVGIGSLVLFGLVGLVAGPNLSKFDTEE